MTDSEQRAAELADLNPLITRLRVWAFNPGNAGVPTASAVRALFRLADIQAEEAAKATAKVIDASIVKGAAVAWEKKAMRLRAALSRYEPGAWEDFSVPWDDADLIAAERDTPTEVADAGRGVTA